MFILVQKPLLTLFDLQPIELGAKLGIFIFQGELRASMHVRLQSSASALVRVQRRTHSRASLNRRNIKGHVLPRDALVIDFELSCSSVSQPLQANFPRSESLTFPSVFAGPSEQVLFSGAKPCSGDWIPASATVFIG